MKSTIESFIYHIPPYNSGYKFIKKAIVFLPYKEVGLNILERKMFRLSLAFETVLKLLSLGITKIDNISYQLGLDISIYKEIVVQMAAEDLVAVSLNDMIITEKGRKALNDLKKIKILKTQLNKIYVNLISGDIKYEENLKAFDRPFQNSMCLNPCFEINMPFFKERIKIIHSIYNDVKVKNYDFDMSVENILYRILDIEYDEMKYIPIECYVYLKESDNSDMLYFSDDKDSLYMSNAVNQISLKNHDALNLFDSVSRKDLVHIASDNIIEDAVMAKNLQDLINEFKNRSKYKTLIENIENLYYSNRYLLNGECRDLLLSCGAYKPNQIVIYTPSINNFISDKAIVDSLAYSKAKEIVFIYNDEYNIEKSLLWIKQYLPKNIYLKTLCLKNKITCSKYIINPGWTINVKYMKHTDNEDNVLIQSIESISFKQEHIQKSIDDLLSNFQ